MPSDNQQLAFRVGWYRSRHSVNHATRRQAIAAEANGYLDEFLQGWLIQQFLCVMFAGDPSLQRQGMGLPSRFDTGRAVPQASST
jgi:hypothetical protein